MMKYLDIVITFGLVVSAIITLWSVLTPNHLFVG